MAMRRASLIVLVACTHPGAEHPRAARPAMAVEDVTTPEVVFVPDLSERRVDRGNVPFGGPLDSVFVVNTVSMPPRLIEASTDAFAVRPLRRGPLAVALVEDPSPSVVTVDYCIDATGQVISVRASGPTHGVEQLAAETVRSWVFAPYFVNDTPVTACSSVALRAADMTSPRPVIMRTRIETLRRVP
jgi:hypothetical protein